MCGIVGVLGHHEAAPIMVEALKRLEYRGYDSAGIATINAAQELHRRRAVGKLVNLSDLLVHEPLPGKAGINPYRGSQCSHQKSDQHQQHDWFNHYPQLEHDATLPRKHPNASML